MKLSWPQRVAVLYEGLAEPGDLGKIFAQGFRSHNCEVDLLDRRESWTRRYDLVIGYGPTTWEGTLLNCLEQIGSLAHPERPFFYFWFIENIPNPALPLAAVRSAARQRVRFDRVFVRSLGQIERLKKSKLGVILLKGIRLKVLGELHEFHRKGVLGGLAVTSPSKSDYIRRFGFSPVVVPIGYHPEFMGADLGLKRDMQVGFLGQVGTSRRAALIERISADLSKRGVQLTEHRNIYGEQRTNMLNRTKVILGIMRRPYDFNGLRFMFCAANKALFVSEPVADRVPFVPGEHFISVPVDSLADTIVHYLEQENERRQIVERAYLLVTQEYTIHNMVGRILQHASGIRRT